MHFLAIVVAFLLLATVSCRQNGYYWREYTGWVPEDALIVGTDTYGNKIHVGQAYVRYSGLLVGRVNSRETYLFGSYNGVVMVGKYIKVLCSDTPEKFYWMKVNARDLKSQIVGRQAVIGGHEDRNGYLYIGRYFKNGEYKVGKVTQFWNDAAYLYYPDNGLEFKVDNYELLMFNTE